MYPHSYLTTATSTMESPVSLNSYDTDMLITPPPAFGGTNDELSPEDLFSAALSSCYILTLKAISRAKKLPWENVEVSVDAVLDKKAEGLAFYECDLNVKLSVKIGSDLEKYHELLVASESGCLISKSLKTKINLHPKIKLVQ